MFVDLFNGLWADRYLIAGMLAAGLSIVAFVPYVRAILNGSTKPDRACWLIWAVLSSLSGASNLIEGAGTSLAYVGTQVGGTVLVCALAVRYGSGHLFNRANLLVLAIAALGIISWLMTDRAIIALTLSIGVSALGGLRTVYKAYEAPETEAGSAWFVLLVASVFGLASVGTLDPVLLAYPLYLTVLYVAVLGARMAGTQAQRRDQEEQEHLLRRQYVPPVTRRPEPVYAHISSAPMTAGA